MEHLAVVARSPPQSFSQRWTGLHHMAPKTSQLTSRYSAQSQEHHSSSRRQTYLTSLRHAPVLSLSHRSPFNPSPAKGAASLLMERVFPHSIWVHSMLTSTLLTHPPLTTWKLHKSGDFLDLFTVVSLMSTAKPGT